ncbi:MAG: polysaccharide deacetylase family protein [Elusimicrobiota bacterium]|nr:polysaccharide deacetylase family protein [Elusimicrobiota bacterium]
MSWTHGLWKTVARARGAFGSPERPGLRVLGYHAVGSTLPGDPYGLSTPAEAFARQMDLLSSGRFGKTVPLGGAKLDGGAEIAVTFDDGYRDALTTAAPILARLSLPFSVCVTPGLLDSGRPHLSWPELKELALVPGCEIGAHGLTHARLDGLGAEDLARELSESRRRLEDALGRAVSVMTWPHGAASRRAADAARAAGYSRAGCSLYGVNGPDREPLLLKRTEIVSFDDERDFAGKASGAWDWFALRQGDPANR